MADDKIDKKSGEGSDTSPVLAYFSKMDIDVNNLLRKIELRHRFQR